jgi:hypothetical protein
MHSGVWDLRGRVNGPAVRWEYYADKYATGFYGFGYGNLRCATHSTGAVYWDGSANCADSLLRPCLWCGGAGAGALMDEGGVSLVLGAVKRCFTPQYRGVLIKDTDKANEITFLNQLSRLLAEASRFPITCLSSHTFRRINPRPELHPANTFLKLIQSTHEAEAEA